MSNFSTACVNLLVEVDIGTAIENAIGHADPIGEQGTPGVPLGLKIHASDPNTDPFKCKLSIGSNDYITFHLR